MGEYQCMCGCGGVVSESALFVKGHHWKVLRERNGVPDVKVCERCGVSYTRASIGSRQSNKHWVTRRFCSASCSREDRAERSREQRGENHPGWKGADATPGSGRMRARRMYGSGKPCEVCGERGEIHHRDGNPLNNEPENIMWVCRKHHIRTEDRMAFRRTRHDKTPEQRERECEYQRTYQLRKKGLLPPPPPPKGTPEQRAKQRDATRRYRERQKQKGAS